MVLECCVVNANFRTGDSTFLLANTLLDVQVDGAVGGVSDQFVTPKTSKKVGLLCGDCECVDILILQASLKRAAQVYESPATVKSESPEIAESPEIKVEVEEEEELEEKWDDENDPNPPIHPDLAEDPYPPYSPQDKHSPQDKQDKKDRKGKGGRGGKGGKGGRSSRCGVFLLAFLLF